jgi:hypothetical protein
MDTRRSYPPFISVCFCYFCIVLAGLFLTSCGAGTPSPQVATLFPSPNPTLEQPAATSIVILPAVPTSTPICTDNLTFISDLTIPDGTVVTPGSILDKQWRIQNSGDCNWDAGYHLRLISGTPLGASPDQALYPARAGTQATERILFTAPQEAGEYVSEWQAYDENGIAFGESFYIKVEVQQ